MRDGCRGNTGISAGQCLGLRFDADDPRRHRRGAERHRAARSRLRARDGRERDRAARLRSAKRSRSLSSSRRSTGTYLGPGGGIVRARFERERLVCEIGREHKRETLTVELALDGGGRLALRSPVPQLSIGFFAEPHDGAIGLMLGLSAYRPSRDVITARAAARSGRSRASARRSRPDRLDERQVLRWRAGRTARREPARATRDAGTPRRTPCSSRSHASAASPRGVAAIATTRAACSYAPETSLAGPSSRRSRLRSRTAPRDARRKRRARQARPLARSRRPRARGRARGCTRKIARRPGPSGLMAEPAGAGVFPTEAHAALERVPARQRRDRLGGERASLRQRLQTEARELLGRQRQACARRGAEPCAPALSTTRRRSPSGSSSPSRTSGAEGAAVHVAREPRRRARRRAWP